MSDNLGNIAIFILLANMVFVIGLVCGKEMKSNEIITEIKFHQSFVIYDKQYNICSE